MKNEGEENTQPKFQNKIVALNEEEKTPEFTIGPDQFGNFFVCLFQVSYNLVLMD